MPTYFPPFHTPSETLSNAVDYLIEDLKSLAASYSHGNDWAKPEIDNVSEAINILDRLRGIA